MARDSSRVLFIAPTAVPGGQPQALFDLAVCLPALGITPEVMSLEHGDLVDRLAAGGIAVEVLQTGRLRDPRGIFAVSRRLNTLLRTRRYVAVVSNEPKAHIYAALVTAGHRIPAFWFQPGYPEPPGAFDRLASVLPATGVIAESRDAAAAQARVNPRRTVHVLHLGIDVSKFTMSDAPDIRARHGIPADAVLVSLIGRLQPWKGQEEFIRAAAAIAEQHAAARFAVVGGPSAVRRPDDDYPQRLGGLVAHFGLQERVIFTGHTKEAERWTAASDIVVNASQPEPFGLVVIEAMASGCAVVAVARGGPRDIIEHARSGLLAPSRDPIDLARAIVPLIEDPVLRRTLGNAARDRVEQRFSRERMTERFVEILALD